MMDIKMLGKIAFSITVMGTITGAAWTAGDYTGLRFILKREFILVQDNIQQNEAKLQQQSEQVQQIAQLTRFQLLDFKRKNGSLTWDESMDRCKIAAALGYTLVLVDGCNGQ